jgi:hypothetical protein
MLPWTAELSDSAQVNAINNLDIRAMVATVASLINDSPNVEIALNIYISPAHLPICK